MSDLVRARLSNGIEKTVGREFAEANDLDVLDEPTHTDSGQMRPSTRNGRPLKPKTTVAAAAAAKQPGIPPAATKAVTSPADDKKEQDQ